MDQSTYSLIIFILVILLLLAIAFLGSNFLMKRAIKAVIKMFRDGQALSAETAKFAEELGIKRRQFIQMRALRDYKPTALQVLLRNNIIQMTEDGRLYLSEDTLSQTTLEQRR